jgi:hypothetical protein
MKTAQTLLSLIIAAAIGVLIGWFFANQRAKIAILSGPYSDNYVPALIEISRAKSKLLTGETNVMEHLDAAEFQIKAAQIWSKRFLNTSEGSNGASSK